MIIKNCMLLRLLSEKLFIIKVRILERPFCCPMQTIKQTKTQREREFNIILTKWPLILSNDLFKAAGVVK